MDDSSHSSASLNFPSAFMNPHRESAPVLINASTKPERNLNLLARAYILVTKLLLKLRR
ncbi:MAG: hypothetical protein ACD_12C00245G0011 [uncultured bacterium]|nr:MAG: hypothetical protein ACD_12C00245G0011 [uncultured bacterium]